MTVLTRNPSNTNYLQATKFLLTFSRINTTQYFCQEVNIPGVELGAVNRATPFLDMFSPGTKLTYEPLVITFTIDEELQSWKDMYNWFISIADPDGFEGRDHPRELQNNKHLSDATLTVLSALNNPLLRIEFTNCFPVSMTDIQFDTKSDADHIVTCTATFKYQSYKYLPV
jgi:hypothetical protein